MSDIRMLCIHIAYIIELVIAQTIFAFRFPRRKLFALRCLAVLAVYVLVVMFVPDTLFGIYMYISLNTISVFVCLVLGAKFMFSVSWKTSILCAIGAALSQHLGAQDFRLLYVLFIPTEGPRPIQAQPFIGPFDYKLCFFAGYILAYVAVWFFLLRRNREYLTTDLKSWQLIVLVGISVIIMYVIGDISIHKGGMEMIVHIIPTIICCIVLLYVLCETGRNNRRDEDERVMRRLLADEQKRYDAMMSSIETVNRKCHDLKYQIAALRGANKHEREAQIDKLEQEVIIYEKLARTGNVALDNTIGEKCLVCENKNIRFTYNVDGQAFSFMEPLDVYILFGSALDNAIECVQKYEESKREISLASFSNGKLVKLHIENVCEDNVECVGTEFKTIKADKENHGFGLMSMRRIAEKYGGNLVAAVKDRKFCVDILFQKQE